ncbi:MAG: arylsulfatase A-like enzyme [Planctomycetota bacterium]|jgi:arylsulfatase A-like enzyme
MHPRPDDGPKKDPLLTRAVSTLAVCLASAACGGSSTPPHVILITMDTLRADALGCYGADGAASLSIDRFAAFATRYEQCVSTAPWTVPSHASLFTGRFPFEHGAISFDVDHMADNVTPLSDEHWTLAEALQAEGYRTGGFVANAVYLNPRYGLSQGFDEWDVTREPGRKLNQRALRWLDNELKQDPERPCMLFINYLDAHRPYNVEAVEGESEYPSTEQPVVLLDRLIDTVMVRGETDAGLEAKVREQYARSVRNLDRAVGELLSGLRDRGLYDDCVIVLTSDHGEYFGEHGLVEHSKDVYEEALSIPLIVRSPAQSAGQTSAELASLVDVPGLILDCLPDSVSEPHAERFLRRPGGHLVFAENHFSRPRDLLRPEYKGRFKRERTALYTDEYKYIHSSDGQHELFRRAQGEGENLLSAEPEVAAQMAERLQLVVAADRWNGTPQEAGPLDAAHQEAMRGLGYLGSEDEGE